MTPLLLSCPRSDCVIPDTLIVFVTYLLTTKVEVDPTRTVRLYSALLCIDHISSLLMCIFVQMVILSHIILVSFFLVPDVRALHLFPGS